MGKIILWYKNGGEPRVFENKAAFVSTAKNWDLKDAGCKVFDVDDPDAIWEDANKWMTTYINKQNAAQAEHDRKRIAELEMRLIKLETEVKRAQGLVADPGEAIHCKPVPPQPYYTSAGCQCDLTVKHYHKDRHWTSDCYAGCILKSPHTGRGCTVLQ